MRVTHVITRLIVGGAQENTIASVLGLRQKPGLEVDLIAGPTSGPEGSLVERVKDIPRLLTIVPELVRPIHPLRDFIALRRLEKIFRERKPDIVHTHSGKAGFIGRRAAARAGVPIIVHTIHGPSFGPFQGRLANMIFRAAERYAGRVTTHFVAVADAMTEVYFAAGIGRRDQYSRVFSGFSLQPFLSARNESALRARYGLSTNDVVIGKIARLFKLKGHDDLFTIAPELVKANPDVKFLIVGDGQWRGRFEALARNYALKKKIVFTGLVGPEEVAPIVGIMDVLVHLSRREGLPRALPQALAAGKPVVAYDCDGAREVCVENQSGFLIKPGDLRQLSARLKQLIADAELRQQLGQKGRELVREKFSEERMVEDLYALYRTLWDENLRRK